MTGPTPLPVPNGSSIGSRTFTQLCHKVPIGYNATPHIIPQNYPLTLGNLQKQPNTSSSDQAAPPSQTSYRSDQPFFHNPLDRQKDTHTLQRTDRWSRRYNLYQYLLMLSVASNSQVNWKNPTLPYNTALANILFLSPCCCEMRVDM